MKIDFYIRIYFLLLSILQTTETLGSRKDVFGKLHVEKFASIVDINTDKHVQDIVHNNILLMVDFINCNSTFIQDEKICCTFDIISYLIE